jgi:hypothetical protein
MHFVTQHISFVPISFQRLDLLHELVSFFLRIVVEAAKSRILSC